MNILRQKNPDQIDHGVTMTSSLLCWVSKIAKNSLFQIAAASSSFIQTYWNLVEIFDTHHALDKKAGFYVMNVSFVWWRHQHDAGFSDK